jgi:hypothetical protein
MVTTGLAGAPMPAETTILDRVVVAAMRTGLASILVTSRVGGKTQTAVNRFAVERTLLGVNTSLCSPPVPMIGA